MAVDFVARELDSSEVSMTGEQDGVILLSSTWPKVEDPGGALDGVAGDCGGAGRMTAGRVSGDGYCIFKDADGQTLFIRWYVEDAPSTRGTWQLAGGTGKWATAVGGGLWAHMPSEAEGVHPNHITGSVDFE